VQCEIHACQGDFDKRYQCTETILLAGERHGIVAVVERMVLTLLLPSVAWGVWWMVLRRIRGIYWLPKPMGRFRSFART
jgi:glucose-6-phosphate dehydrogenase assembly protein OpcA